MLFSRPEGKVVSRLGVTISRIARFCLVFAELSVFTRCFISISEKDCQKYSIVSSGNFQVPAKISAPVYRDIVQRKKFRWMNYS